MISIIVAAANNGVIGKAGGLPWHLPAELARFKQITTGHPIIMGRVTHESIGRTLPDRRNIVITSDKNYKAAGGSEVIQSLDEAIKLVQNEPEVFIIGGDTIYKQALPSAEKIYLTKVDADIKGDKFFKFNPIDWRVIKKEPHKADEKNKYNYEFQELMRKDT